TGAPSSDTELMSGARSRNRAVRLDVGDDIGVADVDEDFLTAARRAAREAAAEATDPEAQSRSALGRLAGAARSHRGALLAAALAVAVAFAAYQIVRNQMAAGDG